MEGLSNGGRQAEVFRNEAPTLAITFGDEAKRSRRQVPGIVGPFELE